MVEIYTNVRMLPYNTADNFGRCLRNSLSNSCVRTTRNTRNFNLNPNPCLILTLTPNGKLFESDNWHASCHMTHISPRIIARSRYWFFGWGKTKNTEKDPRSSGEITTVLTWVQSLIIKTGLYNQVVTHSARTPSDRGLRSELSGKRQRANRIYWRHIVKKVRCLFLYRFKI